jgi:hypothetical protein
MNRREFIAGIGGAVAWPLGAQAQQQPLPVVGLLIQGSEFLPAWRPVRAALVQGLAETGYVEGGNVVIEERFGLDDARLRELASDLVRRRVAVVAAPGSTPAALAAKAATSNHSDHLQCRRRSSADGSRTEPQSARRQSHRSLLRRPVLVRSIIRGTRSVKSRPKNSEWPWRLWGCRSKCSP